MYKDLQSRGELYIIEVNEDGNWTPIGDVTLAKNALPIVIGEPRYRGKNLGKKIVEFLVSKARAQGWDKITLKGIYKKISPRKDYLNLVGLKKLMRRPNA